MFKKILIPLIILSVIVGIVRSCKSESQSNRQQINTELREIAYKAMYFYKNPRHMGGGSKSWSSVDNLCNWLNCGYPYKTNNGTYHFVINGDVLSIIGTGNVTGKDGSTNVRVTMEIIGETSSITTTINN